MKLVTNNNCTQFSVLSWGRSHVAELKDWASSVLENWWTNAGLDSNKVEVKHVTGSLNSLQVYKPCHTIPNHTKPYQTISNHAIPN